MRMLYKTGKMFLILHLIMLVSLKTYASGEKRTYKGTYEEIDKIAEDSVKEEIIVDKIKIHEEELDEAQETILEASVAINVSTEEILTNYKNEGGVILSEKSTDIRDSHKQKKSNKINSKKAYGISIGGRIR